MTDEIAALVEKRNKQADQLVSGDWLPFSDEVLSILMDDVTAIEKLAGERGAALARVAVLEGALEPFAKGHEITEKLVRINVPLSAYRNARAVITPAATGDA